MARHFCEADADLVELHDPKPRSAVGQNQLSFVRAGLRIVRLVDELAQCVPRLDDFAIWTECCRRYALDLHAMILSVRHHVRSGSRSSKLKQQSCRVNAAR